jgi:Subunit 11 of the general transcription factor TFIIH
VALLRPDGNSTNAPAHQLSTTDKVRIKSLIEETRVVAVNCASSAGYSANDQDFSSDSEDEEDDDDRNRGNTEEGFSATEEEVGIELSRIYKRTLEILGDSLG